MSECVVSQNVANLYTGPDTSSSLASQAVLGERLLAGEERNGFCRVTTGDRYQSWIDARFLAPPDADTDFLYAAIATLFADVYAGPDAHSEILTKLTVGTRIPLARRPVIGVWVPVLLPDTETGYVHEVSLDQAPHSPLEAQRLETDYGISRLDLIGALGANIGAAGKRLIGTPYLWGGTTPFGIDCSGLTQLAYKINGIQLLRDAYLQFSDKRFERVEEGQSLETALLDDGDLVAFSRREDKRPTHIGLALGDGRFLHSRGGIGVRIDFCDAPEYAESYLGAVRLRADTDFLIQSA